MARGSGSPPGSIDEGMKNLVLVLLQILVRVVVPFVVVAGALGYLLVGAIPATMSGAAAVGLKTLAVVVAVLVGWPLAIRGWASVEGWAESDANGEAPAA